MRLLHNIGINLEYRNYRDENNCYLKVFNRIPYSLSKPDHIKQPFIIIKKDFLGSTPVLKKETVFIQLKVDKHNMPIEPTEKEIFNNFKNMKKTSSKLSKLSPKVYIKSSKKQQELFKEVKIEIEVSQDLKIVSYQKNDGSDIEIVYKNKKYIGYTKDSKKTLELVELLGYKDAFVIKQRVKMQEAIKKQTSRLFDGMEDEEINNSTIHWLAEKLCSGALDTIEQTKALVIFGYEEFDVFNTIISSFYNTFKKEIQNNQAIRLEILAQEAEYSKYELGFQ